MGGADGAARVVTLMDVPLHLMSVIFSFNMPQVYDLDRAHVRVDDDEPQHVRDGAAGAVL